jgi:hypothetical protein
MKQNENKEQAPSSAQTPAKQPTESTTRFSPMTKENMGKVRTVEPHERLHRNLLILGYPKK